MKIEYHRQFLKHFKKRIAPHPKLVVKFEEKLQLRLIKSKDVGLKDHRLLGSKSEFRSFSVTGDIRVVYKIEGNTLRLYDIGTHNQLY